MSQAKKVIVWGSEDILSFSIQYLLASKEDWIVISATKEEELAAGLLAFQSTQEDIVIVHQQLPNRSTESMVQLLQDYPTIKLILINLESNTMAVFTKQTVYAKQAADLITVIEKQM